MGGYDDANFMFWDDFWERCDDIFEFEEKAKGQLLNDKFSAKSEYNKCAKNGVQNSLDKWFEKCLTPSECNEYGELAASFVIGEFCESPLRKSVSNIKASCEKEAKIVCKGSLWST